MRAKITSYGMYGHDSWTTVGSASGRMSVDLESRRSRRRRRSHPGKPPSRDPAPFCRPSRKAAGVVVFHAANLGIFLRIEVVEGDFLARTCKSLGGPFHEIVMNPPFVLKGDPCAYIDHVLHAYLMLAPEGRPAAVTPIDRRCASRKQKVRQFRDFVEKFGGRQLLPADSFEHAGTSVRATVVMLEADGS